MRNWSTTVFYQQEAQCTTQFMKVITDAMQGAGLTPLNPETGKSWGDYLEGDSFDVFEFPDLNQSLAFLSHRRGGGLALWYEQGESVRVNLTIQPCGSSAASSADDAYAQFGWASLSLDTTYFEANSVAVVRERYIQVFRWSLLLAIATQARYGWGDLDRAGEFDSEVRASDLVNFHLPRVSWWAYYNRDFASKRGRGALSSPGFSWLAADVSDDGTGFVVVLHPPVPSLLSSREDGQEMGLL